MNFCYAVTVPSPCSFTSSLERTGFWAGLMEGPRGVVGFGQLCSKAEAEGRAEERAAMLGMASPPRVAEARGSVGLPGDQR